MSLSPEAQLKFRQLMIRDEGYSVYPYTDTVGKTTIGIGYNLSDRGLPSYWIEQQFQDDWQACYRNLSKDFSWFSTLTEDRQMILINMCFMGYKKFLGFTKMLDALAQQDYKQAAVEMLDSKWAKQVGARAERLAKGMIKGELEWDF